jgi:DNA topoisomerase-1
MLIIVESPAKAKTIAKIVGNKYLVKASVGHIRSISSDKKTTDGRKMEISGIDIEQDFNALYVVDDAKKKVVSELKKLAKESKNGILFATDADREGEAISWHLSEVLGVKDKTKVKRLEFHEITKSAIENAIKNPRPLDMDLVQAQKARQVLDKLVGYKMSPVLWAAMGNYNLSVGRVQTPALVIVTGRENEIKSFVSTEFWDIKGIFGQNRENFKSIVVKNDNPDKSKIKKSIESSFKFTHSKGQKLTKDIISEEIVQMLIKDIPTDFEVSEIKNTIIKYKAPAPFITSTLQQAANSKLGMNPKIAMQLAQKLYEGIDIDGTPTALISYMRTDSVSLSREFIESARGFIKTNYPQFLPVTANTFKAKAKNAQEAHEAIRPVNALITPESLRGKIDNSMWRMYNMIWRHTIACQMSEEISERCTVSLTNTAKDQFSGSTSWVLEQGYKIMWNQDKVNTNSIAKKFDLKSLNNL